MPPSAPSIKGSGFTKIDHAVADSTGAKFNERSEDDIFNETFFMQVSIISNANGTLEKIEPVNLPNGPGGENF